MNSQPPYPVKFVLLENSRGVLDAFTRYISIKEVNPVFVGPPFLVEQSADRPLV